MGNDKHCLIGFINRHLQSAAGIPEVQPFLDMDMSNSQAAQCGLVGANEYAKVA
jgi:hypothetical protein